jgi:hypothetical protein
LYDIKYLCYFPLSGALFAYYFLWKHIEKERIKVRKIPLLNQERRRNMKKTVCAVLIFTMMMFLNPLSSDARGGHGGGAWGWWLPWAIIGGAAILTAPYYAPPPPVIIREQSPVYVQPAPVAPPSSEGRIFVYPRKGQSEELQARDRYECHSWAVSQTHFDPTQPASGATDAYMNQMRSDYLRAMAACLDGRGYTMK